MTTNLKLRQKVFYMTYKVAPPKDNFLLVKNKVAANHLRLDDGYARYIKSYLIRADFKVIFSPF